MSGSTYIVTGVGGFVGRALALRLREGGDKVIGIARGEYPELVRAGCTVFRADIGTEPERWSGRFAGAAGVFHTAAKVDLWGPYSKFFRTNVIGTRNILAACERAGVPRLVYTSSPSVVADGGDLCGVDESYPYPRRHAANYPATKAVAEEEVLAAARAGKIRALALRPHLIFGPGDTHLVPTIVARARAGRLVRIGDGTNVTDFTYIDDCVAAHLAAMKALERNPACVGRAYFISQGEPIRMWDWIGEVLERSGVPPISRSVSTRCAKLLGAAFEIASALSGGALKPQFTRFLVSQMATSHYFNIGAARRDLGFHPQVSMAHAMNHTFPFSQRFSLAVSK